MSHTHPTFHPQPDLAVVVPGRPRGQGSLSLWRAVDGGTRVKHPRDTVLHRNLMVGLLRDDWRATARPPLAGPVAVRITAEYPRPRNHYGTGRNQGRLKCSAPHWVAAMPDIDKVARLVLDALTISGVLVDDAQVSVVRAEKHYADTAPRTLIEVYDLNGGR